MDISSSTTTDINSAQQVDVLKKSMDIQEKQALKVLESVNEQSKEVTAQKTGIGNNINITG